MKRLAVVVLLAFALSVIAGYAADEKKKVAPEAKQTLKGTVIMKEVAGKKVYFLKTEVEEIEIADAAKVSAHVGKMCTVIGTVSEEGGKKMLKVTEAKLLKEATVKKLEPAKKVEPAKKLEPVK